MVTVDNENDWATLVSFLPEGWEEQADELGVLGKKRKVKDPVTLLRLLLTHLAGGYSLRETVVRARESGLVDISDVALLKRFKKSSPWLQWLAQELLNKLGYIDTPPECLSNYHVLSVDASVVSEPGSTGTDYRLHYCYNLISLLCEQFIISGPKTGEMFANFTVKENDLFIGDRAYGNHKGFSYLLNNKAHFLCRIKNKAFTIFDASENKIDLLEHLKNAKTGQCFEFKCFAGITNNIERIPIRICVMKKSEKAAEESIRKAQKEARRKQINVTPRTLDFNRYIIIATSLPDSVSCEDVLNIYRYRWQIEIAFKRLKGVFKLGHLPKKDKEAAKAWLHGKMFVALLVQRIADECLLFSPWGYPIPSRK